MRYHYIIKFNDLSNEKQLEIQRDLEDKISNDKEAQEYLFEVCGSDPFDLDKPDTDRILDHTQGCIWRALDKAWTELEVEVHL